MSNVNIRTPEELSAVVALNGTKPDWHRTPAGRRDVVAQLMIGQGCEMTTQKQAWKLIDDYVDTQSYYVFIPTANEYDAPLLLSSSNSEWEFGCEVSSNTKLYKTKVGAKKAVARMESEGYEGCSILSKYNYDRLPSINPATQDPLLSEVLRLLGSTDQVELGAPVDHIHANCANFTVVGFEGILVCVNMDGEVRTRSTDESEAYSFEYIGLVDDITDLELDLVLSILELDGE